MSRAAEDEAPDSVAPAPAKSTALKEDEPPEKKSESDLPEVLSDADIARMERGEAVKAFAARQSVLRSRKDLDPAVKERLEAEVEKLREKMRSTQATQPAAAPKGGGG